MWVAPKRETVIGGINIINSPAIKIFQVHVLTRTGGINRKTIGNKFDFSCIFDWRLWMNDFVNTCLSGECWYLFNEIQP